MRTHLQPAVQFPDKLCVCNIQYINVIFVYMFVFVCVCDMRVHIIYMYSIYWKVYNDYIVGGLLVRCSVFS